MDRQDEPAFVATLAGDDTIFIATKNSKTQAVALRRLEAWFGDKRER
jgi:arginine repressor